MKPLHFFLSASLLLLSVLSASAQPSSEKETSMSTFGNDFIFIAWHPEPVVQGDLIKVGVNLRFPAEVKVEILSAIGTTIAKVEEALPRGRSMVKLYTTDFDPGLYVVRVSTEFTERTEKIVIRQQN
ncbi:MAG: T9SS type A sorting domain-containing protein [Bacteroidota bacterium]